MRHPIVLLYCRRSLAMIGIFMLFVYWWPATTHIAAERGLELVRIVAWPGERSMGYTERFVAHFEELSHLQKLEIKEEIRRELRQGLLFEKPSVPDDADDRNPSDVRYAKRLPA